MPLLDREDSDTLIVVRTARQSALFSAGRLDEADDEYRAICELSPTAAQLAESAAVQVHSLTHRNRFAEAIALGTATLRQLDIAVPNADRLDEDLDRQFGHLDRWLAVNDFTAVLTRPHITDPTLLTAARLINAVLPACYIADPVTLVWLGLEAIRIWLDHGPAPTLVGPAAHSAFAAVAMRGDPAAGYRALRQILALGEARGYEPGTSQAWLLHAVQASVFEPAESGLEAARRARDGLIAGGELTYAAYTYRATMYYLWDCAPALVDVAAEVRAGLDFTRRTGNEQSGQSVDGYRWLVAVLRGEDSLSATTGATDGYVGNPLLQFYSHLNRAIAAAVFGDAAGLSQHTAAAMALQPGALGPYPTAICRLLHGLALAEQARTTELADSDRLLAQVAELTAWLAERAANAPANFSHLVRLLEAERAWAADDFATAAQAFDAALREVDQRQRPWHRALTIEHAGRFYLAHGMEHAGHQLLAQARQAYAAWGATAKVAHLDWAYPVLRPGGVASGARAATSAAYPVARADDNAEHSAGPVTGGTIDLLGILSASQALSSETTTDRLHARVADVLAAMTGATDVRLYLWNDELGSWLTNTPAGTTSLGENAHTAPMTVLRYLQRTNEPLVVADVAGDDRFARDPHLAGAAPCSLLAVPIHSRGALRAALLLENRLLRGAFTADRLEAVTLIAGQLAVSLDNAQLYADLSESRKRIVATADHTRRRIERDLHDGAQQRLVSLALHLRAAQACTPPGHA
ncbi:MAG TPA: GAF domain-containing protein, partial [Actinoplanes sp.]|nr:GAF domain-containing protein [Actinoplanes sp.]